MRSLLLVAIAIGGVATAQPTLYYLGMLNAASPFYADPLMGEIAPGEMFVIQGKDLGPAEAQWAKDVSSVDLAGTSVSIAVGDAAGHAAIIYTSSYLVAGIMPTELPAGAGSFSLTYNGTSASQKIRVVERDFGIFTQAGDGTGPAIAQSVSPAGEYRLNTFLEAAQPGDVMVLWGSGIGRAAPNAKVLVGGKAVRPLYAGPSGCCRGMDQIVFEVPAGVEGCFAPVAVDFGGGELSRNFAAISIAARGGECSDPHGYSGSVLERLKNRQLQRLGSIILGGTIGLGGSPPISVGATASFWNVTGFGSGVPVAPPFGSCTLNRNPSALFQLLGASPQPGRLGPQLLSGTLNLHGPHGDMVPVNGPPSQPSTLPWVGGRYTIENGKGGLDVGPFQASVEFPGDPVLFVDFNKMGTDIDTDSDMKITWSGANSGYIEIFGGAEDGPSLKCTELADRRSFTIPAAFLRSIKHETTDSRFYIQVLAYGFPVRFEARGLDWGQLQYRAGNGGRYFTLK